MGTRGTSAVPERAHTESGRFMILIGIENMVQFMGT